MENRRVEKNRNEAMKIGLLGEHQDKQKKKKKRRRKKREGWKSRRVGVFKGTEARGSCETVLPARALDS